MTANSLDIRERAVSVLLTREPRAKAKAARIAAAAWRAGEAPMPDDWPAANSVPSPARPARPELVPPAQVPRRRLHTVHGRAALLHAIAHIEFNAIDLAFDLVARFGGDSSIPDDQRRDFISDWLSVGDDEARHFVLIADRLADLDTEYGDLPAHSGLWDAAEATAGDLAGRLAVAPLVLEARGLDVTPGMIKRLQSAGDAESASRLDVIYREEIGHVAAGARWFRTVSQTRGEEPQAFYHGLVRTYFRGHLKPPFNFDAREKAGLPDDYYLPLAAGPA